MIEDENNICVHVAPDNISSIVSSNSEADASELPETIEEMFLCCLYGLSMF